MIIDQLFENKKNTNESLADEFMAMAKAKGYNPRLRGTPDEERARTDAMLAQRAADRAAAPAPAAVSDEERAGLEAQLQRLQAEFDPDYEFSDDHRFWTQQKSIAQQINTIKQKLSQGVAESRRNKKRKLDESWLMEDPVYRKFKRVGRYIAERKLTEPEILKIFADAETGMTDKATGANRTFLGRGKDTTMDFAGGVADALKGVWSGIQSSTPISLVDVAYDKATDALADLTGGQKGVVMQAIKKYRMLAKEYPKTAGLAKGALVAITGLATGGAGLPAVAALIYGLDAAVKGEKFSDIALKAGGAAATAWAASKLASAFGSQPAPSDASAGSLDAADQVYQGAGGGASGASVPVDGGTYTTMPGDQGGFIAQAQGVPFKDLEALNPQITNWDNLPPGTELQLPPSGPNTGSVWQSGAPAPQGPEILGGPSASGTAPGDNVFSQAAFDKEFAAMDADMGGVGGAAAAAPAPSPLTFDPVTKSGTVTLPSGESVPAKIIPVGAQFEPRLPPGGEYIKIPYGGQEVTGYVYRGQAYFTKFPAELVDAAGSSSAGASTAGTLSGVTSQQIMASPVYQQAYAQEIARYGAEPSARAIQTAQQIATMKAKAAMAGAVREATEFTRTVKMRQLSVDKLIDQKLTTLSWALNESVGKPQGRSMHLTPLGVYTVFENIRRVGEAAVEADAPWDLSTKPNDPRNIKPGDRGVITVPRTAPTPSPAPAPTAPTGDAAGPGREALPDLLRPDMADAPTQPADPAKKSWFGKGLDYLDRGVKKVGGVIGNLGHQLTTGVTKEKLKMNWHQAGKPTDSDQLSAWLVKQGVPIGVVNGVYEKMGLPVSAEPVAATDPAKTEPQAKTGGAQRQMAFYGTNPATNKPWTYDELMAKSQTTPTSDPAPAELDAEAGANTDTTTAGAGAGAGVFGNMAAQLAARPTTSSTGGTTTGVSGVGKGVVRHTASATNPNQPKPVTPTAKPAAEPSVPSSTAELPAGGGAGIRAANPFGSMASSLSGDNKAAADLAAADLENLGAAGTASAANKTRMASRIPKKAPVAETQQARRIVGVLKKPVSEMLQMVETKEDVNRIKQFIDQTFTKYGAVNESTFAVRNIMIEHVTKVGAQRRREHARKGA